MYILPATDLYDGKVVRLYKGDYDQMTVYSDKPLQIARDFAECGAEFLHVVDLEGARDGTTPNRRVAVEYVNVADGLSPSKRRAGRSLLIVSPLRTLGACHGENHPSHDPRPSDLSPQ